MSKFILTGKNKGIYNESNPIERENLFELGNFYPNGMSFNEGNLIINMYGLENLEVGLDGRYSFIDHTHDISDLVSGTIDYVNLPFSQLDVTNWNTSFSWGNHASAGYITGISVTSSNTSPITKNIGVVEGVILKETVTKLNEPTINGNTLTLSYTDETNTIKTVSVDLSSIVSDESGILSVGFNTVNNIITISEVDGDIWYINLSSLVINTTNNSNGTVTVNQGGTVKFTISKVGTSGQWVDLLNRPTTISGYNITDAYSKINIDGFFGGTNPMPGYNKTNWDAAFGWGNHASAGYLTSLPPLDNYLKWNLGINGTYTPIQSNNNVNFVGTGGTTITRSGDTITINSTATSTGGGEADGNNFPTSFEFNNAILRLNRNGLSPIDQDLADGTIDVIGNLTLNNSHNGMTLLCSNTLTITIPSNLNSKFSCNILNVGDNNKVVTVVGGTGVTLKAPHGPKLLADYTCNIMKKTGANIFHLQGELTF